jgi:hypothetical protein
LKKNAFFGNTLTELGVKDVPAAKAISPDRGGKIAVSSILQKQILVRSCDNLMDSTAFYQIGLKTHMWTI